MGRISAATAASSLWCWCRWWLWFLKCL